MEKKVFRSRISVLLMVFILAILSIPLIAMVRSGNISNSEFYTIVGVLVFIVLLMYGIRYEITSEHIKFSTWGTFKFSRPLSEVISVERSYNILSSPAFSLKRLRVSFQKGNKLHLFYSIWPYWLISPVREQEFLETLKTINPSIKINVSNEKGWWRIWDWDI